MLVYVVFWQFLHEQAPEHRPDAAKHGQYNLRHLDALHLQVFPDSTGVIGVMNIADRVVDFILLLTRRCVPEPCSSSRMALAAAAALLTIDIVIDMGAAEAAAEGTMESLGVWKRVLSSVLGVTSGISPLTLTFAGSEAFVPAPEGMMDSLEWSSLGVWKSLGDGMRIEVAGGNTLRCGEKIANGGGT